VLAQCRAGVLPSSRVNVALPTLREALVSYCAAKGIKASSAKRYDSMVRTHFPDWLDRSVEEMGGQGFAEHCLAFVQSKGKALVEVGRGLLTALIKYLNAVHGLALESPFGRLAAAGLMPERSQPRARVLQEADLPEWKVAVDKLGEKQRDYLHLMLYTGLRRNEGRELRRKQIDLVGGVLSIPMTKNGKPHSLPITPLMREILERRCVGLSDEDELFAGVSAEHIHSMTMRLGAPRFMLHDLRKLLATEGETLGLSDAVLRRILNHTAPKTDVLHRHYVGLGVEDVRDGLERIQANLNLLVLGAGHDAIGGKRLTADFRSASKRSLGDMSYPNVGENY
jgi:integrase